jgi:hypothetical protein
MSIYDKASLVLIPSGTKTSKVYSQKPVNGDGDFTFSRSTAATRVNADGNIEKETQNLLLQSNSFDTTWYNSATAVTSGQAGYDGTNDAWLASRGGPFNYVAQDISTSGVQSYSIYAKAGSFDWIYVRVQNSALAYRGAYFDLSGGSVGAVDSAIIDTKIELVGNEYYRCTILFNETLNRVLFYPVPSNNGVGAGGSGTIYVQDAQLEQGLVARDYIETTTAAVEGGITDNVPRLDYTDSSCPALLLEPQRSNLVPFSEYFGTSDWVKLGAGTGSTPVITHNYAESPEGLNNATRIQLNLNGGTSSGDQSLIYDDLGAKTGNHTRSVYIKSLTTDTDLYFAGTLTDRKSITATTEWQRFDFTSTLSAQTLYVTIGLRGTTGSSDTADILVWGFQAELGSYATSYIPTYGTSVTRNAEICSKTSISSLIGQTGGTLFLDFVFSRATGDYAYFAVQNASATSRVRVSYTASSNTMQIDLIIGGSASIINTFSPVDGTRYKIAVGYKSGDSVGYLNGVQVGTQAATFTYTDLSILTYENPAAAGQQVISGRHNQTLLFKTRLSNEELAALTTI